MPTETIVRSRNVSFRDIYIAAVTANTSAAYTADTPTKFARAIDGKVSDKFTSEKIYSDDGVEDVNVNPRRKSLAVTFFTDETNADQLLADILAAEIKATVPPPHVCKDE